MKVRLERYIEMLNNYKNHGQNAEQSYVYAVTGEVVKADNIPSWMASDFADIQIKSARATICRGTTAEALTAHMKADKATDYIYICKDGAVFRLDREAYFTFAMMFCEKSIESKSNGGTEKLRFNRRFTAIRQWLETNC